MTVWEFEETVWVREGIRIVIRADRNEEVEDYHYERAAEENRTLAVFRDTRIQPKVGDRGVEVIDGSGQRVHGARRLRSIRNSY